MKYCDNCNYLSIKENEQLDKKSPHICKILRRQILHQGHHPRLPRPKDCPLEEE